MKVAIVEANMTGIQHSYPNGIYTTMISKIMGNENVDLYCTMEHFDAMNIESTGIDFYPIEVVFDDNKMIKKFFCEYKNTIRIIKDSKYDLIIFLSCFANIQLCLLDYVRRHKIKTKIIIFTHGELEGLIMNGKWKIWSYPFWINLCFKNKLPSNVIRIVLGESIKNNLKSLFGDNNIFYIDQPRNKFADINMKKPNNNDNIFAYIGDFLEKKGASTYLEVAKKMNDFSNSKFFVIGPNHCKTKKYPTNIVFCGNEKEYLSAEEFDSFIQKATYACFPYPSNTYKLTASGAVLDAIRFLKPIIYIGNDYFDGIFQNAGNIGYRCKDEEDFVKTIKYLDNNDCTEDYKMQVDNLKKIQSKFSMENVKCQLGDILKRVVCDK